MPNYPEAERIIHALSRLSHLDLPPGRDSGEERTERYTEPFCFGHDVRTGRQVLTTEVYVRTRFKYVQVFSAQEGWARGDEFSGPFWVAIRACLANRDTALAAIQKELLEEHARMEKKGDHFLNEAALVIAHHAQYMESVTQGGSERNSPRSGVLAALDVPKPE